MNELLMLGNPLLRINDKPLVMRDKKGLGLIAYLAVNGETNRDKLADLLWSELNQTDARRNLRQRLYELKTKIPSQILTTQGDMVRLETPIKTDLSWYQTQLESGDFEAAVQVWRGAFLDALEIPGAEGFSEWLENTRTELNTSYHEALRQVASTREANGDLRGALEAHKRLLQDDELQEFHQREVMRLLELLGENETALLQFVRFSQTLDQELGDTPLPETRAIAQRLRNTNTRGSTPVLAASPVLNLHVPLIGRESTWKQIKAKTKVLHLILGEPGVGKSRLASDFAQDYSPTITLQGREGSSGSALYPIAEALRRALQKPNWLDTLEPVWKTECARLIPEFDLEHATHAPPASLEGRVRFLEGLSRALIASLEGTGTIILDDLQWFDPLSLEFIAHLTRRSLETNLRLIATARPQELSENENATTVLNDLKREGILERHPLNPLKERDVRALLQALTGGNDAPRFAQRLHHATTGNPFFMLETLRDLFSAGELQVMATGEWHTPYDVDSQTSYNELRIPTTVMETVIGRVNRAGVATRRLLEAASLAGDGFDLNLIASATALNEWEGLEGIERAVQAELLEVHPNGYKFNHDLTRRALEDGLSPDRRKLLHRKLAVSLATQNGMPDRIAVHFEEGGQSREAAPWRVKAAKEAARLYAYKVALEHYQKALEDGMDNTNAFYTRSEKIQIYGTLNDSNAWQQEVQALLELATFLGDPSMLFEAHLAEIEYLFRAGDYQRAIDQCDDLMLLELKDFQKAQIILFSGRSLQYLGKFLEAKEQFLESLVYVKENYSTIKGQICISMFTCSIKCNDFITAKFASEEAIKSFKNDYNIEEETLAISDRGNLFWLLGEYSEATNFFKQALFNARKMGNLRLQRFSLINLINMNLEINRVDLIEEWVVDGLNLSIQSKNILDQGVFHTNYGRFYVFCGKLGLAYESFLRGINCFEKSNAKHLYATQIEVFARFCIDIGDIDSAKDWLDKSSIIAESMKYNDIKIRLIIAKAYLCLNLKDYKQAKTLSLQAINSNDLPNDFSSDLAIWIYNSIEYKFKKVQDASYFDEKNKSKNLSIDVKNCFNLLKKFQKDNTLFRIKLDMALEILKNPLLNSIDILDLRVSIFQSLFYLRDSRFKLFEIEIRRQIKNLSRSLPNGLGSKFSKKYTEQIRNNSIGDKDTMGFSK